MIQIKLIKSKKVQARTHNSWTDNVDDTSVIIEEHNITVNVNVSNARDSLTLS